MFNLLNNPWVIGVGGGIISGLFILWLTPLIFSKRYEAETRQKADATNREVIYAIRAGIPEGIVPPRDIVEALINATTRKYGAPGKYIYDCAKIGEELIKEVMDSSFISAKQKSQYCDALKSLVVAPAFPPLDATDDGRVQDPDQSSGQRVFAHTFSWLLALITGLATATLGALVSRNGFFALNDLTTLLLPTALSLIGVILGAYFMTTESFHHRRRRISKESESVENGR